MMHMTSEERVALLDEDEAAVAADWAEATTPRALAGEKETDNE